MLTFRWGALLALGLVGCGADPARPAIPADEPARLVVLYRSGAPLPPNGRWLLADRLSAAQVAALDPVSPRAMLERYVVLSYSDAEEAAGALARLHTDPAVAWAGPSLRARWSADANDPGYVGTAGWSTAHPSTYQWGMHDIWLDVRGAWDYGTGHAYLADVNSGIQLHHPELADGVPGSTAFRAQLSRNFTIGPWAVPAPNVDEDPDHLGTAGHGTHVAGIMVAKTNNSTGVAGVCPGCSLIAASWRNDDELATAITWAVDVGAQVVNLSAFKAGHGSCTPSSVDYLCLALAHADQRDVVIAASAGNNPAEPTNFPASDPRVIAVGGTQSDGSRWYDHDGDEGGTSTGPVLLSAPAKDVQSTFYTGATWRDGSCFDRNAGVAGLTVPAGYGACTGTSMAAPFISAIAGLVRSANPLISKRQVAFDLQESGSASFAYTSALGYGEPDAASAITPALAWGTTHRTPLFAFYSARAKDHFYTTVPQMGMAAIAGTLRPNAALTVSPSTWRVQCPKLQPNGLCGTSSNSTWPLTLPSAPVVRNPDGAIVSSGAVVQFAVTGRADVVSLTAPYVASNASGVAQPSGEFFLTAGSRMTVIEASVATGDASVNYATLSYGSTLPFYNFPGANGFSPQPPPPRAIAALYTENPPGGNVTPLWRLSFRCGDAADPICTIGNANYNPWHVSHVYATQAELTQLTGVGYKVDGVEGYLVPSTSPQPAGTAPLCRLYSTTADDYILFAGTASGGVVTCTPPEAGYAPIAGLASWIGWAPTTFSNAPPAYRGSLDAVTCSLIAGWGWDAAAPDATQTLDLWLDGKEVLTFPAGGFRPDLLTAGIGNGNHAFAFPPPWLRDGQPHTIRVTFDWTPTDLPNSPQTLTCAP